MMRFAGSLVVVCRGRSRCTCSTFGNKQVILQMFSLVLTHSYEEHVSPYTINHMSLESTI